MAARDALPRRPASARSTTWSRTLLNAQRPDGSWEIYYAAPNGDINSTVECYAALRCVGHEPGFAAARRAREAGSSSTAAYRKSACSRSTGSRCSASGRGARRRTCRPRSSRLRAGIRSTSTTSRAGRARRCCRSRCCPRAARSGRCRPTGVSTSCSRTAATRWTTDCPRRGSWLSWRRLFLLSDRFLHLYQKLGFTPGREIAINACLGWIVRHQDADGAWGGIQPPWIYSLMALNVEGYALDASRDGEGARGARRALGRTSAAARCTSRRASRRSGTRCSRCSRCRTAIASSRLHMQQALDWVLANEVRYRGDWAKKVKGVEPSGWAFERANLHYPDIDDTAVALIVLARLAARAARRAADPRNDRSRARLDARDAVEQRRLGGVRQGQRPADPHQDSVLRLRRGARPAVGRRDRARARSARPASASTATIAQSSAAMSSCAPSRNPTAAGSAAGA